MFTRRLSLNEKKVLKGKKTFGKLTQLQETGIESGPNFMSLRFLKQIGHQLLLLMKMFAPIEF